MITISAICKPEDADRVDRRLVAYVLLMAANMHCESGGNDASFIHMARRSLALVRTGAVEQ